MKHLKLFETYKNTTRRERVVNPILEKQLGDVVDESDIYSYVQALHHTDEDFSEGNLGERIEWYPQYKLSYISLSSLDLDEWYWDEEEVNMFEEQLKNGSKYPPIVVSHDYSIIDGTHRANALNQAGIEKILAFVGIGNDEVYDPFD